MKNSDKKVLAEAKLYILDILKTGKKALFWSKNKEQLSAQLKEIYEGYKKM